MLAAIACGSSRSATPAPTTVTAADHPAASAPPPAEVAAAPAPHQAEALPGELVCKITDAMGVQTELFVDGAKAELRRIAPSGTSEVKALTAGRHGGMIIADKPGETDLVVHAATVRDQNGKRYMRLGDWNEPWTACE
jgi:hypothetical protein